MRNTLPIRLFLIVAPFVAGCQSDPTHNPSPPTPSATTPLGPDDKPAAYLDGKVVTQGQLYRLMTPAHGGDALAEVLIDRAVQARLKQQAIELNPADIESEKTKLLASLDPDPDQAARLLKTMRRQRGLDGKRFTAMLRRNAGLRRLVRDQITLNDAAINQAYQLRYGKRYQVRLIVTDQLDTLTRVRRQVASGASFTELAIQQSTDSSARQGGLLSPISPADPTYPKAIRDALARLKMDSTANRLSPAIALDQGYALLYLEDVLTKDNPPTRDQARPELAMDVRSELERLRMRQLARTLIEQANVVVLDPRLDKAWQQQKDSVQGP